jgi:hypothetical protein
MLLLVREYAHIYTRIYASGIQALITVWSVLALASTKKVVLLLKVSLLRGLKLPLF